MTDYIGGACSIYVYTYISETKIACKIIGVENKKLEAKK
jgi:hypothetical protein